MSSNIKENQERVDAQIQYLLFYLKDEVYAIEALLTSEIVEYSHIAKVPMMASYVKGVTNIRGNIVAVVDLADRFKFGESIIGPKSSIIVLHYTGEDKVTEMGIIIDEVYEVDDIPTSDIKDVPEFGTKIHKRFISKMAKYKGEYIPILNTQAILDIKELSQAVE